MTKISENTGSENTETLKNNAESTSTNTDTTSDVSETANDNSDFASGSTETGSGDKKTASGNTVTKAERVQFSVRTNKENKRFFDEFHDHLKKTNPDTTADQALTMLFDMASQASHIPDLLKKVEILENKAPEIKEVIKEVVKEIPVKLEPSQVLIGFDQGMIDMIRKCRPFLKKKSVLTWDNDAEFMSKLTTASIRKFLLLHCDHIINPL